MNNQNPMKLNKPKQTPKPEPAENPYDFSRHSPALQKLYEAVKAAWLRPVDSAGTVKVADTVGLVRRRADRGGESSLP